MCHEWGHYFQDKNSRDDTVAGDHGVGMVIDPRVAFSEGFGNAWAGVMRYPDHVYKDSHGALQAESGNCFDVQNNDVANPGWYSEFSVQAVMYNTFDPAAGLPETKVSLGTFIDALTGRVKTTDAFTTLFPFVHAVQTSQSGTPLNFNTLLSRHGITAISDDYGTGQAQSGGVAGRLPIYQAISLDGPATTFTLQAPTDKTTNQLAAHRYLKVSVTPGLQPVLRTSCAAGMEIMVLDGGRKVANFVQTTGEQAVLLPTVRNGAMSIDVGLERSPPRP